jgi:hypothetical protein
MLEYGVDMCKLYCMLILTLLAATAIKAQAVDSIQVTPSEVSVLHRNERGIAFKFGFPSGFGVDYSSAWFGAEINSWLIHSSARLRFYPLQSNFAPYVGVGIGQWFTIGHGTGPGSTMWNEGIIGLEFGRRLTAFRLQYQYVFNQHGPGKEMNHRW